MKLLLCLTSLCISCAPVMHRPVVFPDSHTQIRQVVSYMQGQVHNLDMDGWRIKLVGQYIVYKRTYLSTRPPDIYVFKGITDWTVKTITVYNYQECLAASSLPHELLHVAGYLHSSWDWYFAEGIHQRAIKALCGDDYQVVEPPPFDAEKIKKIPELPNGPMDM